LWRTDQLDWVRENALLVDVRSPREYGMGHVPEAINVPHTAIREHVEDIIGLAAGRPVRIVCASGFRSYLAHRILAQHGIDSATFDGGMQKKMVFGSTLSKGTSCSKERPSKGAPYKL
jgi:rhodanese-related sulfurtransferase